MIFKIDHIYDVDGGFGDAIKTSETLGYVDFINQESADKWCEDNSKTHVYDIPYQELETGTLKATPVIVAHLPNDILPDWWETQIEDDTKNLYPNYDE